MQHYHHAHNLIPEVYVQKSPGPAEGRMALSETGNGDLRCGDPLDNSYARHSIPAMGIETQASMYGIRGMVLSKTAPTPGVQVGMVGLYSVLRTPCNNGCGRATILGLGGTCMVAKLDGSELREATPIFGCI